MTMRKLRKYEKTDLKTGEKTIVKAAAGGPGLKKVMRTPRGTGREKTFDARRERKSREEARKSKAESAT